MPETNNKQNGKVIELQRWENLSRNCADPKVRREAVLSDKIVSILKDMLQSWRMPKASS